MPSEITVAQLFEAYYDCRKSKRTTHAALAFEVNLEENLLALLRELQAGTWSPSPATVFAITRPAFVLKADVANFFGSIRHRDLFSMLTRRVRDATILDLCRKLVFQDVRQGAILRGAAHHMARVPRHKSLFHAPPETGLPIGNLSSQFFANVYLDGLDQMIKRRLGMRHYVRYVDDMVLVHRDPKVLLGAADAIRDHLSGIGLELSESKTFIAPADRGVDFVGQVIRPRRRIGRAKTHRTAIRRLSALPKEDLTTSVNSYLGLFRHTGSTSQCTAIARLAHQRGLRVAKDLSKAARAVLRRRYELPEPVRLALPPADEPEY